MNGFKRLTTDKPNGMYELAHNSCYIGDDGAARYRDFETDIDARDLTRKLMVSFGQWKSAEEYGLDADNELIDDDIFDDSMMELLSFDNTAISGLIALFYRNLWAMADLRECLKAYEDAEEQGLLVKLPCKIGSLVYKIKKDLNQMKRETIEHNGHYYHRNIDVYFITQATFDIEDISHLGKTVFITKEKAEAALAKLESEV